MPFMFIVCLCFLFLCNCFLRVFFFFLDTLNRSIDGIPTGTTIPSKIVPGSNGNEGVLHTPQNSKTGASPANAI